MQHPLKRRRKRAVNPKTRKAFNQAGLTVFPQRKWKRGERNKWLSSLRGVIGKSQVEFAAMVGVKKETIIYIENGRQKLTTDLANRIRAATGVCIWSYFQGNDTVLVHGGGPQYTRKDFDDWKQGPYCRVDEKSLAFFMEESSDTLMLMLRAAKECGTPKNRLPALRLSFNDWCWQTVKDFHLEKALNDILQRERRYTRESTRTYQEWRAESEGMKLWWGFLDDPRKPGSEPLTITHEEFPQWGVGGGLRVPKPRIQPQSDNP
jgi:DNA-binding XRE family transcriptional regulator